MKAVHHARTCSATIWVRTAGQSGCVADGAGDMTQTTPTIASTAPASDVVGRNVERDFRGYVW